MATRNSIFNRSGKKEFQVGQIGEVGVLVQDMQNQAALTADVSMFNTDTRTIRQFVTNQIKETVFYFEPLTYGAINKTANRLIFNWLRIDSTVEGETIDESVRDELEKFYKKIQLKAKLVKLCIDAMVYGNGYLELVGNSLDDSSMPLNPAGGLKDVVIADPLFIKSEIRPINMDKDTGAFTEFFYVEQPPNGGQRYIHNSRIIHVPWSTLGTMRFGRGVIEIAIRSVLAKLNMDWALGEVIYRHGKPFIVLKTTNAGTKELEKAYKILQNINPRTHFAGTDRHDFQMLNPSAVNPEPFAQFYYFNLAAACEMPQMEFLGAQAGQLTGSEVDKVGWNVNLKAKQELKFTPVIDIINSFYFKGNPPEDIGVFWNDIYVDEQSQAAIHKTEADMVKVFMDAGIVTDIEARQLCRDLGLPFPDDDTEFQKEADLNQPLMPGFPGNQTPVDPFTGKPVQPPANDTVSDADKKEFIHQQEQFWKERKK